MDKQGEDPSPTLSTTRVEVDHKCPSKQQNHMQCDQNVQEKAKEEQHGPEKNGIKLRKNGKLLGQEIGEEEFQFNYQFHIGEQVINQKKGKVYRALELLGVGTFGQVLLVQNQKKTKVAMKVYKKQNAYIAQGLKEVKLLHSIASWEKKSQGSKTNYLNTYDAFPWREHLCVVMELMDSSLLDILTQLNYEGVQMKWIQIWAKQILFFLAKIHEIEIFHCDIKPQNIMFRPMNSQKPLLIDFNSSCTRESQPFSYFQSRPYRSPEVLFGMKPFTGKIDIWSFGCVLAQLYLGLPLFPGACEYDQVQKIYQLLHDRLPDPEVFQKSQNGLKYFYFLEPENSDKLKTKQDEQEQVYWDQDEKYQIPKPQRVFLKRDIDYQEQTGQKVTRNKGFSFQNFEAILEYRNPNKKQIQNHQLFIDLLKRMLVIDPSERISAEQAFLHPFIGGTHSQLDQLRLIQETMHNQNQ